MSAIAVDWSGAKQVKEKLWLAHVRQGQVYELRSFSTREEAVDRLIALLKSDEEAVGGLDFAFSFPGWFIRELNLADAFEFWTLVEREGEGWLRDCEPPFWGRKGTEKSSLPNHFRRTEERAAAGRVSPKSCFQILGPGTVGTGTIRGIPFLPGIREAGISIWPFDSPELPMVVEIYPRTLTGPVQKNSKQHRSEYVEANWPNLPASVREVVVESEDAFDAAVSALVMDRSLDQLQNLPPGDAISRLEGEIWSPAQAQGKAVKCERHD